MAIRDDALRMLGTAHTAAWTGALLLAAFVAYYLHRAFAVRSRFQRLQRQGVPMIPHHPVFGHLGVVGRMMATKLPADAHPNYMGVLIQDHWRELFPAGTDVIPMPPAVYVDLWPFTPPFLLSLHGDVSAQFTQDHNPDHPVQQSRLFHPLTGQYDVAAAGGEVWAVRRRAMNPAFSANNIAAHVPGIAEEVGVLVRKLRARAGRDGAWGGVFPLQELTTRMTLDVIYRFSVGARAGDQDGDTLTPASASLVSQIKLLRFHTNISTFHDIYSPLRGWKLWRNSRVMDSYLLPLIRARFDRCGQGESEAAATTETTGAKTLLDVLAKQHGKQASNTGYGIRQTLGETKHALFAGHETTSFALCTVLNMLAQHPRVLARVRAEVDEVLQISKNGSTHDKDHDDDPTGLDRVIQRIRESPHLVNGLVYTTAVIKETMRLETNIGTLRAGRRGFSLHGPATSGPYRGVEFPTEGCIMMDANHAIHRGAAWGESPLEFAPERWLPSDGDGTQYPTPPRNAYRPFEQGPRNCVGQLLAMTELRLATALVARELDVECAWDEWDEMTGNKGPKAKKPTVWGSRLYHVNQYGVPQLKDGMPVHVRLRSDVR